MFKPGDIVIYVVDGNYDNVTVGKTYTISDSIFEYGKEFVSIIGDDNITRSDMYAHRFKLDIKKQRKQKLEKICSK